MAVEDVIEEPVVAEPVVEIEPTKDEAILLEIQKSKQEALEAKKLVEDMKALLEAKEKNEKTVPIFVDISRRLRYTVGAKTAVGLTPARAVCLPAGALCPRFLGAEGKRQGFGRQS